MPSNNYFNFGSYTGKAQEIPKSASPTSVVINHKLHFYTTAVNIPVLKFKIFTFLTWPSQFFNQNQHWTSTQWPFERNIRL